MRGNGSLEGELKEGTFWRLVDQSSRVEEVGKRTGGAWWGEEGGRTAIDRHETKPLLLPLVALTPHHTIRRALPPP